MRNAQKTRKLETFPNQKLFFAENGRQKSKKETEFLGDNLDHLHQKLFFAENGRQKSKKETEFLGDNLDHLHLHIHLFTIIVGKRVWNSTDRKEQKIVQSTL